MVILSLKLHQHINMLNSVNAKIHLANIIYKYFVFSIKLVYYSKLWKIFILNKNFKGSKNMINEVMTPIGVDDPSSVMPATKCWLEFAIL
jgi:hypothetical protein